MVAVVLFLPPKVVKIFFMIFFVKIIISCIAGSIGESRKIVVRGSIAAESVVFSAPVLILIGMLWKANEI